MIRLSVAEIATRQPPRVRNFFNVAPARSHDRTDTTPIAPTGIQIAPTRIQIAPARGHLAPTRIQIAPARGHLAPTGIRIALFRTGACNSARPRARRVRRAGAPALPFRTGKLQKRARVVGRLVTRPADISRHLGVARIAREDRAGIVRARPPQQEPGGFNLLGCAHCHRRRSTSPRRAHHYKYRSQADGWRRFTSANQRHSTKRIAIAIAQHA